MSHPAPKMDHPSMQPKVQDCQRIIGYDFKNQYICWEALQTAGNGIVAAGQRRIPNGNKRLAILGEYVIGLVISQDWYDGGSDEGRESPHARQRQDPSFRVLMANNLGKWTKIRQKVITNDHLGSIGQDCQLDGCVQLGNGQTSLSKKMMATAVEAVVGAVYLDGGEGGLADVREVMQKLGIWSAEMAE